MDSWGRTPLHWAVRRGDLAAVHALLSAGADVDVQDHARKTPLHFAAETLDRKCLQLLLQAKANPNIIDASGANPALCAVVSSFVVLPLVLADTFPSKDSICRETHQYLISTIADNLFVDHLRKTCERVITFSPCWRYHPELIGILCERGRNIDKHGSSIIFWATRGVYCPRVDALDVTMEQQRRILDTINPRSKFRSLLEQLISTIEVLRQDSKPEDEPGEPSYTQRRGQVTGFSDSLQVVVACLGVALIAITLAFGIFPV